MMDGIFFYIMVGFVSGAVVMWLVLCRVIVADAQQIAIQRERIRFLKERIAELREGSGERGDVGDAAGGGYGH